MDIRSEIKSGKTIYELPLLVSYYARVSTDSEVQATSIVNQVDYFEKYIKNNSNWQLVGGYIDEGISGKEILKRENFMKMIRDGMEHKFDLVLTKSVSRFARNTIDSIYYTNLLLDWGIGVFFLNDNINTVYSDSEFRLTLMASIAQDELRKLSESVKFGLRQSINRGVVLGNDNILGYRKNKGKLVIIDEEALIVKDIFNLFLNGNYTYSKLARFVNKKYGKHFNSTSIKRILTNYKYKGYYCGKKTEVVDYKKSKRKNIRQEDWVVYRDYDNVPPIIEEEIWELVNKLIKKRGMKNTSKDKYEGKVFCVIHGKMVHKGKRYKKKYYHYYGCSCCNISGRLLDRVCGKMDVKKIVVIRDDDVKLQVFY